MVISTGKALKHEFVFFPQYGFCIGILQRGRGRHLKTTWTLKPQYQITRQQLQTQRKTVSAARRAKQQPRAMAENNCACSLGGGRCKRQGSKTHGRGADKNNICRHWPKTTRMHRARKHQTGPCKSCFRAFPALETIPTARFCILNSITLFAPCFLRTQQAKSLVSLKQTNWLFKLL